eukprot:1138790-Pelagomonas_calceolata.AAC.2
MTCSRALGGLAHCGAQLKLEIIRANSTQGDATLAMLLAPLAQQLCSAEQDVACAETVAAEVQQQAAQQLEAAVVPIQAKLEVALMRCEELEGCLILHAEEAASARAALEAEAGAMGERAAAVQVGQGCQRFVRGAHTRASAIPEGKLDAHGVGGQTSPPLHTSQTSIVLTLSWL